MKTRLFITAYDVLCSRRLRCARQSVTAWAQGGQKSVLECWALNREGARLYGDMCAPLDADFDKLGVFHVGAGRRSIALGRALPPRDAPIFLIG